MDLSPNKESIIAPCIKFVEPNAKNIAQVSKHVEFEKQTE